MPLLKLDHVNVRTAQLEVMVTWYSEVLGMHRGERPSSQSLGAWMYLNGVAHVHLVSVEGEVGAGAEVDLKLEHFAFSATGLAEFESKLQRMDVGYRRSELPAINLVLFNLWDPDGNHIHVDFPADE